MPELNDDMYCSQQICIPPTYPYVLRQFAKAAIRTQPPDLLRWSTAYFRCLSLNVPAPVKPRLEYPVPIDYYGITPGWLRALNHQLQNNEFVSYKLLWDRWMGICLRTETLIEILCLGGFVNNLAIPWFRFIGLCAGHLTRSLTDTMILVCEILTEEPEGGSAMISLETFLDIYKFLACIDASQPQTLYNIYFTDSVLDLLEKVEKAMAEEKISEVTVGAAESLVEEEEYKIEMEVEGEELGVVISCPDLADDDFGPNDDVIVRDESLHEEQEEEMPKEEETLEVGKDSESVQVNEEEEEENEEERLSGDEQSRNEKEVTEPEANEETSVQQEEEKSKSENYEEEVKDETDDYLYEQAEAKIHFPDITEPTVSSTTTQEVVYEPEPKPQEVYVPAIPGIGPIVPSDLMKAVVSYMKEMAAFQHGMVMPRNIRHFNCPPLEVLPM